MINLWSIHCFSLSHQTQVVYQIKVAEMTSSLLYQLDLIFIPQCQEQLVSGIQDHHPSSK